MAAAATALVQRAGGDCSEAGGDEGADASDVIVALDCDVPELLARSSVPPRLFTVAGSDSGGGAGIQADLKTFAALQCFGMSAITAITAQNTEGVQGVEMLDATFVGKQIESVLADLGADAVKTGMLGTKANVDLVAAKIREYGISTVVVDPVMVSTSGHVLLEPEAVVSYRTALFPVATVITPNLREASHIVGFEVRTRADMRRAAEELKLLGPAWVLVKGGDKHGGDEGDEGLSADLLFDGRRAWFLESPRVLDTRNVHGTGCTLASAIAAFLARDPGRDVLEAVKKAKRFITALLRRSKGIDLGKGKQSPLHHAACSEPPAE